MMMLGDRVSGVPFSLQDLDLLKSIGDQVAASLLNIQFSQRLSQAKQLEAFQAMSAFFVHDLKNTASTLSLMLQNLPMHFKDPQFREDALRGIAKTVTHINDLISRLSMLRHELAIQAGRRRISTRSSTRRSRAWSHADGVNLVKEFRPLPKSAARPRANSKRRHQPRAQCPRRGAVARARFACETAQQNGWVILTVTDNGCGMNAGVHAALALSPVSNHQETGASALACSSAR